MQVEYTKPGTLPDAALEKLNRGLSMDGKPLLLAKVRWQNEDQLSFTLREGRKRQIRRMCDMVGLRRLSIRKSNWRPAAGTVALSAAGRAALICNFKTGRHRSSLRRGYWQNEYQPTRQAANGSSCIFRPTRYYGTNPPHTG